MPEKYQMMIQKFLTYFIAILLSIVGFYIVRTYNMIDSMNNDLRKVEKFVPMIQRDIRDNTEELNDLNKRLTPLEKWILLNSKKEDYE